MPCDHLSTTHPASSAPDTSPDATGRSRASGGMERRDKQPFETFGNYRSGEAICVTGRNVPLDRGSSTQHLWTALRP